MLGFFQSSYQKIRKALTRTRSLFAYKLRNLLGKPWKEETFEELEQTFYEADLGAACAAEMAEHVRQFLFSHPKASSQEILLSLQDYALNIFAQPAKVHSREPQKGDPLVILIAGVNGSGKTTSIAKLAQHFREEGKKVLVAAADTFRAAAIDQLAMWAERVRVDIVKGQPGADPAAVVFDALQAAKARNVDVVLIDTAGRLQNKRDLMQELRKVHQIAEKVVSGAPHETWLVLDSTTGQNGLDQAETFHSFTPLSGLIVTKLDGSAKGGIILSIYKKMGVPLKWIGTGEGADDLMPFDADSYVKALFEIE
jgi:fused signal recognition particle receptor